MKKLNKLLIFIVAYNAEKFIESVISRIPIGQLVENEIEYEILIIDDNSSDFTFDVASNYKKNITEIINKITIMRNPVNLGYGGNQKLGYQYAIDNGFDAVVLLHGDGQYAPEILLNIVTPIFEGKADYVLGSRMLNKKSALKGRMPLYKFVGNICLTTLQNLLLKTSLSEFHTGYRAYSVSCLTQIPFNLNSNDFDFDTEILIQLIDNNYKCKEISIPTYYGDEICHVNGIKYAYNIIKTTIVSRLQRVGIFYKIKYDYESHATYTPKINFASSHTWAISQVPDKKIILDIGCSSGFIAKKLNDKQCITYGIDQYINQDMIHLFAETYQMDLDSQEIDLGELQIDFILMLDVIEHLSSPETFFLRLREAVSYNNQKMVLTTGNIAFLPVRLSLLLGLFNYGKRGILDKTHKRLYTFGSITSMLSNCGYKIEKVEGIPAPFPLVFGDTFIGKALITINKWFIRISKGMFSYQIAIIATPQPTTKQLLKLTKIG